MRNTCHSVPNKQFCKFTGPVYHQAVKPDIHSSLLKFVKGVIGAGFQIPLFNSIQPFIRHLTFCFNSLLSK